MLVTVKFEDLPGDVQKQLLEAFEEKLERLYQLSFRRFIELIPEDLKAAFIKSMPGVIYDFVHELPEMAKEVGWKLEVKLPEIIRGKSYYITSEGIDTEKPSIKVDIPVSLKVGEHNDWRM